MNVSSRPTRLVWLSFAIMVLSSLSSASTTLAPAQILALDPPLPPQQLLQKLSLVLHNRAVTHEDIDAFRDDIQKLGFETAYQQAVVSLLAMPAYRKKVGAYHNLLWQLDSSETSALAGFVIGEDRPYGEIYSRNYIYVDDQEAQVYRNYQTMTLSPFPDPGDGHVQVFLSPGEPRFRGIFGSPQFLSKYPDTPTNVNRKRSSHVFRIGFCEILANPDAVFDAASHLSRSSWSSTRSTTTTEASPLEQDHGTNPDCIGCHRRLDPMARFFDRWPPPIVAELPPQYDDGYLAQGTLWLGGTIGMDRSFPGTATQDLGKLVVSQPEFKKCVVSLAWRMVYASDTPMPDPTRQALIELFDKTKSFNSLIKSALEHPYFWSTKIPPPLIYTDVSSSLKVCAGCHTNNSVFEFDPAHYPFDPDPDTNRDMLKKIWQALNQADGAKPMPPPPIPSLERQSINALQSWIEAGAHDASQQPTLSDEQIEEILQ